MNNQPLEFLVQRYINPRKYMNGNICFYSIPDLNSSQLDFLAQNLDTAKKYISDLLINHKNKKNIIGIEKVMSCLEERAGTLFTQDEHYDLCSVLINQKRDRDVVWLSRCLRPSEEQIKGLWDNYLHEILYNGTLDAYYLESLLEEFGNPGLSQDKTDELANKWLSVQAGEKECRQYLQPEDMKQLMKALNIKPNWDKNLAKRVYSRWLDHHFHDKLFTFLQEDVKISPDSEKVELFFTRLLGDGKNIKPSCASRRNIELIVGNLERAVKIFGQDSLGILNSLPKKYISSFYINYISSSTVEYIKRAEKILKVPYSRYMQKIYDTLLISGNIQELNILRNKTKIDPQFKEETIQKSYNGFVSKGFMEAAVQIYLFTEVDPELKQDAVVKGCKKLLKRMESSSVAQQEFKWIMLKSPEYSIPIFQNYIKELIEKDKLREAEMMLNRLPLQPYPEEQYVLACEKADWETAKEIFRNFKEIIKKEYPAYSEIITYIQKQQDF